LENFPTPLMSSLDSILFDFQLAGLVLSFLTLTEVVLLESLNHIYLTNIRSSSEIWSHIAELLMRGKTYIPAIIHRLLIPGNHALKRLDLEGMSVKNLSKLVQHFGLDCSKCCGDKNEVIKVVSKRELSKKMEIESLSRFAVRICILDKSRNSITEDELCSFSWNIRVRGDGVLAQLVDYDPWWTENVEGPTTTRVFFEKSGKMDFVFSGPSAFQHMLQHQAEAFPDGLTYSLDRSGSVVHLCFGVREYVARHPQNWGFILISPGSVWTSFVMPSRDSDSFLCDSQLNDLVSPRTNYGFNL
jgi:hypothetical protein